ncbi:MAG: hypothetical protein AB8G95_14245 [Anaerolineae bacterium]
MNEQQQIKEIQIKIASAGTPFERSAWQTKLAWHFAERENWHLAGSHFQAASATALADSESDENAKKVAAQLFCLEGLAWGNAEDKRPEAMRALEQALVLYESLSDQKGVREVQKHLDALAKSGWQKQHLTDSLDEALKEILLETDDLYSELNKADQPSTTSTRIALLRTQALVHGLNGDQPAAQTQLEQAIVLAEELGDGALVNDLNIEIALLPNLHSDNAGVPETVWQNLIAQTAGSGRSSTQTTLLLEQAAHDFGEGLYDDVVHKCRQARLAALSSHGPKQIFDYFSASLMLASAQERKQEDVEVLDTLLRCKTTLERELGKPAGEPLKELLNNLLPRWGETRFNEALHGYRQRMHTAGGKS